MNKLFVFIMLWMMSCLPTLAQAPMGGGVWKDNTGKHINAHGGNIFNYKGTYYWYGESRSEDGKPYSSLGVSCFTSKDLIKENSFRINIGFTFNEDWFKPSFKLV